MHSVPVTRAAHLIEFCEAFRSIGVPVQKQLRANKLPENAEEMPDAYLNNIFATAFVGNVARDEGIDDVGWLGARMFSESQLKDELTEALCSSPTVFGRLKKFFLLSGLEDSHLRLEMNAIGGMVEVVADMDIPEDNPGMSASNWTQAAAVIEVVRTVMGPNWAPSCIKFKTDFTISDAARAAFPNTRFVTDACHTAIYFPKAVLSHRLPVFGKASTEPVSDIPYFDDLQKARLILKPYLLSGTPTVSELADVLNMTPRTLQRRLHTRGTTYCDLVETTRFEMAADMLLKSDARILDVATTLGFGDQSNFGRMFRRQAGVSPGTYRKIHQHVN